MITNSIAQMGSGTKMQETEQKKHWPPTLCCATIPCAPLCSVMLAYGPSLNKPAHLPQGLCPCCFLFLECSFPRSSCSSGWPVALKSQLRHSLLRDIHRHPSEVSVLYINVYIWNPSLRLPLACYIAVFSHKRSHFLRLSYLLVGLFSFLSF